MITCVFAGHRQIFKANISEKSKKHWKTYRKRKPDSVSEREHRAVR